MTVKILPKFGFVEHARQWKGARPLRPFKQMLTHPNRNWKLAPRLGRNLLWTFPAPLEGGWKAEEIPAEKISREFSSQSMATCHFSPRAPGFFEYLQRCPAMRMRIYEVHDKSGPRGHFAVGLVRGQARVAGVWIRNPDAEAWQRAFCLAQLAAKRFDGACEVAAAGTSGVSEQAAIAAGFRIQVRVPIFLLNRKGKLALPPDFQFQLSDDDSIFLDGGVPSYLT